MAPRPDNLVISKADWIYDDKLNCHVPCCTAQVVRVLAHGTEVTQKCGGGPLTGDEILVGRCAKHR